MSGEYYRKNLFAISITLISAPMLAGADPVTQGADTETGLRYWEWNHQGVVFRLTQRLPDQTRAFFLARGFDADSADMVAKQCVFQSMFRNTGEQGSGAVTIDLDEWDIAANGARSGLLTREKWEAKLAGRGVPAPDTTPQAHCRDPAQPR
jgi:hypothetical protein